MKEFISLSMAAALFLAGTISTTEAPEKDALQLVQTIPMPEVKGRLDHMDVEVKGKRLFVAGLENGSLELLDLAAGKRSKSVPGFKKPQAIAYVASLNRVFVASGDDGMLVYFARTLSNYGKQSSWTLDLIVLSTTPTLNCCTWDTAVRTLARTTAKWESSMQRQTNILAILGSKPTLRNFF